MWETVFLKNILGLEKYIYIVRQCEKCQQTEHRLQCELFVRGQ